MSKQDKDATVVVVDGYSTGRHLPRFLGEYGLRCVHVQSSKTIPEIFRASFDPSSWSKLLINQGDPHRPTPELLAELGRIKPIYLLPGTETGVCLADALSEELGLPTNGTRLSAARRDKHAMHAALVEYGIPTMPHTMASTAEDAVAFLRSIDRPIVVKPATSAGAEDVYFCSTEEEARMAYSAINGKQNALMVENRGAVCQELLDGAEYIVNFISREGVHCATDIWKCEKIRRSGENSLSALEALLPFEGHESAHLYQFGLQVLNALGIVEGPSHLEVIWTKQGLRLIEAAARLQGAVDTTALQAAQDSIHLERMAQAIADPVAFHSVAMSRYALKRRLFRVFLLSHADGELQSVPGLEVVKRMPTHFSTAFYGRVGSHLSRTTSYLTSPGLVHLLGREEGLRVDYNRIRALELDGFYLLKG